VNLQSGIVRGIGESTTKSKSAGKTLPLTDCGAYSLGYTHFARSALDVEHQRRHAGLRHLFT
uniref:hypothetical protein n=1 Tax=Alistipes finegoldii TaxID=214856 RepID=UPI002431B611